MSHNYGPHRPEDAPSTLEVHQGHDVLEVPRHPALIRQREQINQRAHWRALEALVNALGVSGLVLIPTLLLLKGTA